jgi:hypothetical protein
MVSRRRTPPYSNMAQQFKGFNHGNDQRLMKFWEKITTTYNEYCGPKYEQRTLGQVKNKYDKLSKDTQIFVGCYKHVTNPPKSGHYEKDYIFEASQLFAFIEKRAYTFEHAWRVLKDEPKWKGSVMETHSRR